MTGLLTDDNDTVSSAREFSKFWKQDMGNLYVSAVLQAGGDPRLSYTYPAFVPETGSKRLL